MKIGRGSFAPLNVVQGKLLWMLRTHRCWKDGWRRICSGSDNNQSLSTVLQSPTGEGSFLSPAVILMPWPVHVTYAFAFVLCFRFCSLGLRVLFSPCLPRKLLIHISSTQIFHYLSSLSGHTKSYLPTCMYHNMHTHILTQAESMTSSPEPSREHTLTPLITPC